MFYVCSKIIYILVAEALRCNADTCYGGLMQKLFTLVRGALKKNTNFPVKIEFTIYMLFYGAGFFL